MKIYQHIFGLLLLTLLSCCRIMEYRDYKEIHKHSGNKKYEVAKVISKSKEAAYIHFDTINQNFVLDAYYEPLKKEDSTYQALKVDKYGNVIDTFSIHTVLKDGTMWDWEYYNNWIINGDTSKYSYNRPLTKKEEKDSDRWIEVFRDLYSKASSVYIYEGLGEYYFKVDNKWYKIGYNEVADNAFNKRFPAKFTDVRMIELENHTPDFSHKAFQRDTSLWTYHGYEEADREDGIGLDPINFSAGWHYLQLKMPGSEPLKIKRYGSMGVNMHTYIIPDSLGGREDVVFIVQEPSSLYPDREYGGMYVVRPRELKEK